ncbi:hypothetical protein ACP70R_023437 [Stipagrostis hirtigluma subsp. patula]
MTAMRCYETRRTAPRGRLLLHFLRVPGRVTVLPTPEEKEEEMGRPERGERRIEAAVDHLAGYGFPKPRIRTTIHALLQVYGREGWAFLQEGSYRLVLEKLSQQQPEQDQTQEEAAEDEVSPENDMQISKVNTGGPTSAKNVLQKSKSLGSPSKPSAPEPVPRPPPALDAACYGWISDCESESDSDSETSS